MAQMCSRFLFSFSKMTTQLRYLWHLYGHVQSIQIRPSLSTFSCCCQGTQPLSSAFTCFWRNSLNLYSFIAQRRWAEQRHSQACGRYLPRLKTKRKQCENLWNLLFYIHFFIFDDTIPKTAYLFMKGPWHTSSFILVSSESVHNDVAIWNEEAETVCGERVMWKWYGELLRTFTILLNYLNS